MHVSAVINREDSGWAIVILHDVINHSRDQNSELNMTEQESTHQTKLKMSLHKQLSVIVKADIKHFCDIILIYVSPIESVTEDGRQIPLYLLCVMSTLTT